MNLAHLRNTILVLAGGGCSFLLPCSSRAAEADSAKQPYSAEALWKTLDPFYKQHIVADGLVIAGSEKVSLPALREVGHLAQRLLAKRPDVLRDLRVKGFDPAEAPTFRWPPAVVEAFNRIEAERARNKEEKKAAKP
jgi:hypothetical protein